MPSKKKPAAKRKSSPAPAKKKAPAAASRRSPKVASDGTSKRVPRAAAAAPAAAKPAPSASKSGSAKRPRRASSTSERRNVVPWAERFKDSPGPWTCPKCGPLPQRAQPLYGEDEKHHCPNEECDAVVTLLSPQDLEPVERHRSWPPQRNKQRALGEGGLGGGGGGGGGSGIGDMEPAD